MGTLLPRGTVRLRFTLLYASVFPLSGIGLLVLTNLLALGKNTSVAAHGGRLDLHARPEGGLRVTVALPPATTREGVAA